MIPQDQTEALIQRTKQLMADCELGPSCNICKVLADLLAAHTRQQETLTPALQALERAAWKRSWSELKKARAAVEAGTGIVLTGQLAALLAERTEP